MIKLLLHLDHSEQNTYQTNVHLLRLDTFVNKFVTKKS
jgi:hypothetical protein